MTPKLFNAKTEELIKQYNAGMIAVDQFHKKYSKLWYAMNPDELLYYIPAANNIGTLSNCVEHIISNAPDHGDGAIEAIERRVSVMSEIIVKMVESMDKSAQVKLAESLTLREVVV